MGCKVMFTSAISGIIVTVTACGKQEICVELHDQSE